MECPTCNSSLERTEYEGVTVFQCGECFGYLIPRRRMRMVKSSRQRSPEQLLEEITTQSRPDTDERVRCPRCRGPMSKEEMDVAEAGKFNLDTCKECDQVWFDGGELARWQIDHEQRDKGREETEMQRRRESRTPEQQAEIDKRFENLSSGSSFIDSASHDMFYYGICCALLIGVLVLWLVMGQRVLSGLVSVALVATLIWRIVREADTNAVRWGSVIGLSLLEIGFLFLLYFNS